jgi:hypothetical protein
VAVTDQPGGDGAAHRTAPKHDVAHGAQGYNVIKPVVQSLRPIYNSLSYVHLG